MRPLGAAFAIAVLAAVLAGGIWGLASRSGSGAGAQPAARSAAALEDRAQVKAERAYGKLPLAFERNRGQSDPRVKFLSRGAGYTLFLTPREAVLSLTNRTAPPRGPDAGGSPEAGVKSAVVRMQMVGANPKPKVAGLSELPGKTNYLNSRDRGKWRTNVESYGKVRYEQVWPGTDVVYYGRQGRLEYDFVLRAGADPGRVALAFKGAQKLSVDRRGDLLLKTRAGTVRQQRPQLYQRVAGQRRPIEGRYVLKGGRQVAIRVGAYDRSRPLVIDPVLVYSTYLGGTGAENGAIDIAVDSAGSAYVAGTTSSTNFPTTAGAYDTTCGTDGTCDIGTSFAKEDAFVAKLKPDGSALAYSTFLGGSDSDNPGSIAVDSAGQAYLTGSTRSTDFPTTANAYQPVRPSGQTASSLDAFVTKLAPDGAGLAYSTYLGGGAGSSDDFDSGRGIAVDSSGGAYVAGSTASDNFPIKNAFQAARASGQTAFAGDAFVTKLDTTKSGDASLVYSTYLGGDGAEGAADIGVSSGQAYVVGSTPSTDFPTKNAFQPARAGGVGTDGFVAKLDPSASGASSLLYSTYFGGTNTDAINGVAVEAPGNAYFTGSTSSTDLPLKRAFQNAKTTRDGFVTKLDVTGSPDYSTYLSGVTGLAIAVDGSGATYVTGSAGNGLPVKEAIQDARRGSGDTFVTKFDPAGSTLAYSTYLGGVASDTANGIALDSSGNAYISGATSSTDFPTQRPFQPANAGGFDAFVAKLGAGSGVPFPNILELDPTAGPTAGGTSVTIKGTNLAGATAVKFGEIPAASFTQDSATQITAVSPAHAEGLVDVSVTTAQGATSARTDTKFFFGESPWYRTGSLEQRRNSHTATLLANGKVLVVGGQSVGADNTAELYDPLSGKWTATGKLNFPRREHAATLLTGPACRQSSAPSWCGKVLVTGGRNRDGAPVAQAELYDPSSGQWSLIAGPQTPRDLHTATLLDDGKVLVAGGCSTSVTCGSGASLTAVQSAEIYDPASNSWRATSKPPLFARMRHTATRLADGRVLLVGGFSSSTTLGTTPPSVLVPSEIYDPKTDAWTAAREREDESTRRVFHTATLLEDGKVLVAGGTNAGVGGNPRRSAELYDPIADEWKSTGFLNRVRNVHTATLLPSGQVLAAGNQSVPSSPSELFDPKAVVGNTVGTWADAPPMLFGRFGQVAILLSSDPTSFKADPAVCGQNCGKVLMVGGGNANNLFDAAELYTPPSAAAPGGPGSPLPGLPPLGPPPPAPTGQKGPTAKIALRSSVIASKVSARRIKTRAARAQSRRYLVKVSGRFREKPCAGRIRLTASVKGSKKVTKLASVRSNCTFKTSFVFKASSRTRLRSKLKIAQTFLGNTRIRSGRAKTLSVRLK